MKSSNEYLSPSYFWSCITLSEECPYFSDADPKLVYYGAILSGFYAAFIIMLLTDYNFYSAIDKIQEQFYYHVNFIKKKLNHVHIKQNQLVSTKDRTEKQLKRSEECKHIVTILRTTLNDNPDKLQLFGNENGNDGPSLSHYECY